MKLALIIIFCFSIIGCNSQIDVADNLAPEDTSPADSGQPNTDDNAVVSCNNDFTGNAIVPQFNKLNAGGEHNCFLKDNGEVVCWGLNNQGQLGIGNEDNIGDDENANTFQKVALGVSVSSIDAGAYHSCGIVDTGPDLGKIRCWGEGGNGRSAHMTHANGLSDNMDIGDNELPSVYDASDFGVNVSKVATSGLSTCVLLVDGNVRCWGSGSNGGTAAGHTNNQRYYEDAVNLNLNLGGDTITDLVGNGNRYCVLLATGNMKCWGYNYRGMLGYGNLDNIGDDETTAALGNVSTGGVVTQISLSNTTSCVVFNNGKARCWGRNDQGQLGLGHANDIGDDELPSSQPYIPVNGTIVQMSASNHHTCALLATGNVTCWGKGNLGQKADENLDITGDDEPISNQHVKLCEPAVGISSSFHSTCALLQSGKISCWGHNAHGRLGYGHLNAVGDDEDPSDEASIALE